MTKEKGSEHCSGNPPLASSLPPLYVGRQSVKYVFDLERSARVLRLNRFLHGLTQAETRKRFLDDPERAMQGLSDEEKDMVRRLDWKRLQDYGASFFCLEKLARTKGVSNPQMVAAFRGETLEEFLKTRRVPGAR
jgi:gallate dioxygenase